MTESWIGRKFNLNIAEEAAACNECVEWCNTTQGGMIRVVEGEDNMRECVEIPAPSSAELLRIEVNSLKQYLTDTDYAVVKCFDRGLVFKDEYPELYTERQKARDRINEIENK